MKKQGFIIMLLALFLVGCVSITFAQSGYSLRISSNVKGASIYIDGKYAGKTPLIFAVTAGTHQFKATADGYETLEKTINVRSNLTFSMTLEPESRPTPSHRDRYYELRISSNVRSASIYIDGNYKGKTPETIKLKEGSYTLKVTARGYRDYEKSIRLSNNASITANLERAIEFHSLTISSNMRDVDVYINGRQQRGNTPMTLKLEEGKYEIKVTKRGYKSYETSVYLNRDTKIYAQLQTYEPSVKIVVPSSILNNKIHKAETRIDVYVDGKKERDLEFTVRAGSHVIRIESGAFALEQKIYFKEGKSYTIKLGFGMDVSD